jgi:hypothetical protein
MQIRDRHGQVISTLDDWRDLGGPASSKHWVEERSARCLAESWLDGTGPAALAEVIAADGAMELAGFQPRTAIAEEQTRFDEFRGGPRNHDLLVIGDAASGPVVVGIEGKADEPFGQTLGEYIDAANAIVVTGKRTNAPARLAGLITALVGPDQDVGQLRNLRYQLFSGLAGTLAAAREHEAGAAVFCVHEFVTDKTVPRKREENSADLGRFIEVLRLPPPPEQDDWMVGPIRVPGSELIPSSVPVWVAHLRSHQPS